MPYSVFCIKQKFFYFTTFLMQWFIWFSFHLKWSLFKNIHQFYIRFSLGAPLNQVRSMNEMNNAKPWHRIETKFFCAVPCYGKKRWEGKKEILCRVQQTPLFYITCGWLNELLVLIVWSRVQCIWNAVTI